jgi:SAM-dependent methyltransferase
MIRNTEDALALLSELSLATWTASAIGSLFESGVADALTEPRTPDELASRCRSLTSGQIRRCLDVAVANGLAVREDARYRLADAALPFLQPPFRSIVPADLRSALMQGLSFLDASSGERPRVGWTHDDARILRGQGEGSAMIVRMFERRLLPALDGLAERMRAPDARFLDIGVGVAALAVEMCRVFPNVKVVGVDVHDPALAIARENVSAAQMNERIELRKVAVNELRDESTFDLAWLPSFFIRNLREGAASIRHALRPGGWVVCALVGSGGTEKQNASWSLVGELWGGEQLTRADAIEMFGAAGFTTVRELESPAPGIAFVAARR